MEFHSRVFDEPEDLADWVELLILSRRAPSLSTSELIDRLKNSDLYSPEDEFEVDDDNDDDDSSDAALNGLVDTCWNILKRRHPTATGPLRVTRQEIKLRQDRAPGACFLSICEVGRYYDDVSVDFDPRSPAADLFEEVVRASQSRIFGGCSLVLPARGGEVWSKEIHSRIGEFAERFELDVGDREFVNPDDKDLGLDVATRFSLGADEGPGTFVVLTQCATGKNWPSKRGTPALAIWRQLIGWNAPLLMAFAIPWQLRQGCPGLERAKTTRRRALKRYSALLNDAVILDRPRLVSGAPDDQLDSETAGMLEDWCNDRLSEFP